MVDLLVAATARAYGFGLLTHNRQHFAGLDDLVDVRVP